MIIAPPPTGSNATTASATAGPLLDAIDRGFVARLAGRSRRDSSAERAVRDTQAAACGEQAGSDPVSAMDSSLERGPERITASSCDDDPRPVAAVVAPASPLWRPPDPGPGGPLVDRLLHAAAGAWEAIALRVEDAHATGASVIAITGARRGEGRTTVVACLARALVARGRRVEVRDRAPVDAGLRSDVPIVLVDAGVWFPGGPIRRAWIERESLGCHAAILVRQAGQPPCPARGEAMQSVGLALLGEVLTMVPADVTSTPGG